MTHLIIYAFLTNPYYQLVNVRNNTIWNFSSLALEAAPSPYTDSKTALSKNTAYNGYPITLPAKLPKGDYDLIVKESASPVVTDQVTLAKRIKWSGTSLLDPYDRLLEM